MSYELIETIEVGAGGAASIEFTSIPQDGTDLVVKVSARSSETSNDQDFIEVFINNEVDDVTGLVLRAFGGDVGPSSISLPQIAISSDVNTANTFGSTNIYISNYTSSSIKSISADSVSENNAARAVETLAAANSNGTDPVTSITLSLGAESFLQYTTASLYKVSNADAEGATPEIVEPKATGGSISLEGGYFYHTFTSSGTFTPTESLTSDILVVAGGGGGGGSSDRAGGGGAGGYLAFASESLTAQGYSVTVGAGGSSSSGQGGSNGGNSQFGTLTAAVGGGGGANSSSNDHGGNGGSGGGGTGATLAQFGTGTAGQGFDGGSGNDVYGSAGGGGGAAEKGQDGIAQAIGRDGGDGKQWLNGTYYAGGGSTGGFDGNGTGGLGGGGNGSYSGAATSGQNGKGGGGGAGSTPGNGGSGVVIIRYAA